MPANNVNEVVRRLYASGKYSDLEVRCGIFSAKVHKGIVCEQSAWFAKAVEEGRFLEGLTGVVEIKEQSSSAVKSMVEFLYTGDYSLGPTHDYEVEKTNGAMMFDHLNVYAVADLIQHDDLKRSAEEKFQDLIQTEFLDPCFPDVVTKAYEVSPPGDLGKSLRQIVVDVLFEHTRAITKYHENIDATITEIPALAADLFLTIRTKLRPEIEVSSILKSAQSVLDCGHCGSTFLAAAAAAPRTQTKYKTPRCSRTTCLTTHGRNAMLSAVSIPVAENIYRCYKGHLFQSLDGSVEHCIFCQAPVGLVEGESEQAR